MKNITLTILILSSLMLSGCNNQHNEDYMQSLSTGKVYSMHEGIGDTYFIREVNVTKLKTKM